MQRFLLILVAASSAAYAAPVTSASCHAETTAVTVYGTSEASCFSHSIWASSSADAGFELLDAGLRARLFVGGGAESYKGGSVIDFDPDTFSSASVTVVLFTPGPPRLGSIHAELDYFTSASVDASAPGFGFSWSDPYGGSGFLDETEPIYLGVPLDARLSGDTGPAIICPPPGFCCTHCSSFSAVLSFSVYEADGITPVRLSLEPVPEPSTRALLLCSFAACAVLGVARAKRRT